MGLQIISQVLKCAVMCKKGNLMPTWRMRWFVLRSTDLTCYESKETLIRKVTTFVQLVHILLLVGRMHCLHCVYVCTHACTYICTV